MKIVRGWAAATTAEVQDLGHLSNGWHCSKIIVSVLRENKQVRQKSLDIAKLYFNFSFKSKFPKEAFWVVRLSVLLDNNNDRVDFILK